MLHIFHLHFHSFAFENVRTYRYSNRHSVGKQMQAIASLKLDSLKIKLSWLQEIHNLQKNFLVMIEHLKLFKTFLPSHVLEKFSDDKDVVTQKKEPKPTQAQVTDISNKGDIVSVPSSSMLSSASAVSRQTSGIMCLTHGLKLKLVSVLYIKIYNFLDLLDKQQKDQITNLHATVFDGISKIVKTQKGNLEVLNCREFIATWNGISDCPGHSSFVCKAAAQILSLIEDTNQHLSDPLQIGLGGVTEYAYVGVLGTNAHRILITYGAAVEIGRALCDLSKKLECNCLVNEKLFAKIKTKYVIKPIDIVKALNSTFAVYDVKEEIHKKSDEWMYELENQNAIQRFDSLMTAFNAYREKKFQEALIAIQEYEKTNPNDERGKFFKELISKEDTSYVNQIEIL